MRGIGATESITEAMSQRRRICARTIRSAYTSAIGSIRKVAERPTPAVRRSRLICPQGAVRPASFLLMIAALAGSNLYEAKRGEGGTGKSPGCKPVGWAWLAHNIENLSSIEGPSGTHQASNIAGSSSTVYYLAGHVSLSACGAMQT